MKFGHGLKKALCVLWASRGLTGLHNQQSITEFTGLSISQ